MDPKISRPTPENSKPGGVPNNSNRDKKFCLLLEEFESLYGLALIKENFKKMIFSEYEKKMSNLYSDTIKDEGLIRLRIRDILAPLIRLDTSLCRKHDGNKLKDMLNLMFGLPFSVKTICEEFDEHDTSKKKAMDQYIRRLARQIEKSGIFTSGWIYDKEYGIKRSTKLDNTQFWWITSYHTNNDLWEHVLNYYKTLADKRGKTIEEKAIKETKHDKALCYYCKKRCVFPMNGKQLFLDEKFWMCHVECIPEKNDSQEGVSGTT